MADLDEMLLAPPSRRRRKGSYYDDGSDSRDDDSDDDHRYGSRKPSGSQVPLKKELDPAERDDEHSSSREDDDDDDDDSYDREGDSDDVSVGSDLYISEEDRQRLAKMSELDREMILVERAIKKNNIKKQKEKSTQSRKDSPPRHTLNRAAAKGDVLNELRARKRLRQQDPRKRFTPAAAALSISSHSSGSGTHSEDSESTGGMVDSDDEKSTIIRRPLNVAAEKVRLRREMEVAQMKVEKIKAKLQQLEQKDNKAIRLAEMNRKNRNETRECWSQRW